MTSIGSIVKVLGMITQRPGRCDVDVSGLPCGPKAAFATKGYFANQRNRRGRQLGRVLATSYEEVVVDRLA